MDNRQLKKTGSKKTDIELFFSIFFIILGAFVLALTLITVLRVAGTPAQQGTDPSMPSGDPLDPPPPANAIFQNGQVVHVNSASDAPVLNDEDVKSNYAVLIDASSGKILAQKGSDVRFTPASMTKVMTLIVACEALCEEDLSRKLQLTQAAHDYVTTGAYENSSTSFIKKTTYLNDFVSLEDALYAIGIASAADATYLICVDVAGSEEAFVERMNRKAEALGLRNTHFDNAIGHESENNYTTAADMAVIMAYALQCELIRDILSYNETYPCKVYLNAQGDTYPENYHWYLNSSLFNTNPDASSREKAYRNYYGKDFSLAGATFKGGKTGTLGAGTPSDPWIFSLVSFAEKNGKTYIVVTGETPTAAFVLRDAKKLYDEYAK